jgi:hypothetical protein
VNDVQFYSDKTCGWSGEFGELEFSMQNVEKLNNFLTPVFESGWSSKDFYIFGKHYKSLVYGRPNLSGKKILTYGNGCLFIIFLPFYFIVDTLVKLKVIGKVRVVNIDPISPVRKAMR